MTSDSNIALKHGQTLPEHRLEVAPEWIDENNHMGACYYPIATREAGSRVFEAWGCGDAYRAASTASFFVSESQLVYFRELKCGDILLVRARLWGVARIAVAVVYELHNEGGSYLAALIQQLVLHVELGPPAFAIEIPETLGNSLAAIEERHESIPTTPEYRRLRRLIGAPRAEAKERT